MFQTSHEKTSHGGFPCCRMEDHSRDPNFPILWRVSSSCSLSCLLCRKDMVPCASPNTKGLLGQWFGERGTSWSTDRESTGDPSWWEVVVVLLLGMCISAAKDTVSFVMLCLRGTHMAEKSFFFKLLNLCLALCFFSSLTF